MLCSRTQFFLKKSVMTESLPGNAAKDADGPPERSSGDDIEGRMAQIEKILRYAATPLLQKCALVGEWVRHAEARVSGQLVHKPHGGRPEGGAARAARELPVPGKTVEGRRKFIERALEIDGMWPEAKSVALDAGLDSKCALFIVARERTPEAQIAKAKEIAARKGAPRQRMSKDEEEQLAKLSGVWSESGVLRRDAWKQASVLVRRRFVAVLLKDAAS
jgi:hypothetical protein